MTCVILNNIFILCLILHAIKTEQQQRYNTLNNNNQQYCTQLNRNINHDDELTTIDAAKIIGLATSTLHSRRAKKEEDQPPYLVYGTGKAGRGTKVRYKFSDLLEYLDKKEKAKSAPKRHDPAKLYQI